MIHIPLHREIERQEFETAWHDMLIPNEIRPTNANCVGAKAIGLYSLYHQWTHEGTSEDYFMKQGFLLHKKDTIPADIHNKLSASIHVLNGATMIPNNDDDASESHTETPYPVFLNESGMCVKIGNDTCKYFLNAGFLTLDQNLKQT